MPVEITETIALKPDDSASRALEVRIRTEAKSICESYLAPPHTTDFAILFLPTEGLYAEVLRRAGLVVADGLAARGTFDEQIKSLERNVYSRGLVS